MKGKTNNPNGRPKGKPNKVTSSLRESIKNFVNDNWEIIEKDFKEVNSSERLRFFEKLIPYIIPKLQTVEYVSEDEQTIHNLSDKQIDLLYNRILGNQNEENKQ